MKSPRSYSDPEIARYVLGLDMPERTTGIQALLAHDDAAAARALKWEAYLLGIVDALPAAAPPETLLQHIQQTLGMAFDTPASAATSAPVQGEPREREPAATRRAQAHAQPAGWLSRLRWPFGAPRVSRRMLAAGVVAGTAIVIVVGILVSANLHTVHPTVVHESVPAQTH